MNGDYCCTSLALPTSTAPPFSNSILSAVVRNGVKVMVTICVGFRVEYNYTNIGVHKIRVYGLGYGRWGSDEWNVLLLQRCCVHVLYVFVDYI